jgi:glycosyltransferase involved in cell wall biosynthesis
MPPRVTYWTGTWDVTKEAISKEIEALRVAHRRTAPVVAFSPAQRTRLDLAARVLLLSSRRWLLLRAAGAAIEPTGDVTHVFGGAASWHLLRAVGRRPVVLTAVIESRPEEQLPPIRFARVVVESETLVSQWIERGVPADCISIVRPGVDLRRYAPAAAPPTGRFRLLFASTPSDAEAIEARGIPLLVELARARPDLDIVVPWRAWGDVDGAKAALRALEPPANFDVRHETRADMPRHFADSHATIACFAAGAGKTLPNFVLEGLASGRPCVVTADSALAPAIAASGAGVVAARRVEDLSAAVDRLRDGWAACAAQARRLAETSFDAAQFVASYDRIYRDVSTGA